MRKLSFLANALVHDILCGASANFIYAAGGQAPGEAPRQVERAPAEVEKVIKPYLDQLEKKGQSPEKLEQVIESALMDLAEKYANRLDKTRDTQKAALTALVDSACDVDGNGKLEGSELRMRQHLMEYVNAVLARIDATAADATGQIVEATDLAGKMREDVAGGVRFSKVLSESYDPTVRESYADYMGAVDALNAAREKYGVIVPPNLTDYDAVLEETGDRAFYNGRWSADKPAGADVAADRMSVYQSAPRLDAKAKKGAVELASLDKLVEQRKTALLIAIDNWHASVVSGAENLYKDRGIDAGRLASEIVRARLVVKTKAIRGEGVVHVAEDYSGKKEAMEKDLDNLRKQLDRELDSMYAANGKVVKAIERVAQAKNLGDASVARYKAEMGGQDLYSLIRASGLSPSEFQGNKMDEIIGPELVRASLRDQAYLTAVGEFSAAVGRVSSLERQIDDKESGLSDLRREAAELAERESRRSIGASELGPIDEEDEAAPQPTASPLYANRGDINPDSLGTYKLGKSVDPSQNKPEAGVASRENLTAKVETSGDTVPRTVKKGEYMTKITKEYYKSADDALWRYLQESSLGDIKMLKGSKASLIEPGDVIKLPKTVKIGNKTYTRIKD